MTITAIMFAADDEDVVESSVRHNLHYFDVVFVIGIDSRDETCSIVERLAQEGLPVAFSAAAEPATRAGHAEATLRQLSDQEHIRHVMLIGADHFLEGSPVAFRDAILADPQAVHLLPRIVRVPTETDDLGEIDPYRRLRHRRLIELDPRLAAVLPRRGFDAVPVNPDGLYADGEHDEARLLEGLSVAQLPVRNPWQLAALAATRIGEIAALAEAGVPDRAERVGYWARIGEELARMPILSRPALREAAARFEARDPVPVAEDAPAPFQDHVIRYPASATVDLRDAEELMGGGSPSPAAAATIPVR